MERKLLEKLNSNALPGKENVAGYFRATYIKDRVTDDEIAILINEMTERGWITIFGDQALKNGKEYNAEHIEKYGISLAMKITAAGREYLRDLIRNEKQDRINRGQYRIAIAICAFTFVQAFIATCTYLDSKGLCSKKQENTQSNTNQSQQLIPKK